nr:nuclear valosin containing protein [Hymenolepis microstoma]
MMKANSSSTSIEVKRKRAESDHAEEEINTPDSKRKKLISHSTNDIPCSVPENRIEDIVSTVSSNLLNQIKLCFKYHLNITDLPEVWPSILVNGPPFCGKTKLIKSIAGSLGASYMLATVGVISPTARSWREVFAQAKKNSPCVLHIDCIENLEKTSGPTAAFRVVCLLKNELLPESVGSGVVIVGETRRLIASLPQDVSELFRDRFTFGMMEESCRMSLLSRYLSEQGAVSEGKQIGLLRLTEGLTLQEVAHRTPGYEAGDLLRLIRAIRMELRAEGKSEEDQQIVTPKLLEASLLKVVPAVKSTAEFVTIPDVTWSDVGGLNETKRQLHNQFMLLIDDWERAQALRRRAGGVLLEGPPGCGKTLIAKALSNTAGLNFLSVKGPEILNKFQGESERRIREIFERGRACQPCLIFFDEIDAICPRRDGDESSSGSRVSVVNQLLVELDGIDKHRQSRVFVVGATNRKDMIDEAILRPGRLGLHILISPPATPQERVEVLSACTRGATDPLVDGGLEVFQRIAADPRTNQMSGADLENLLEMAKLRAQLARRDFLTEDDLTASLNELKK